jgi:hypothetical protein
MAGKIRSIEQFKDLIRNRTCDLLAYSILPRFMCATIDGVWIGYWMY